jgi:hypothetical protein
MTTDSMGEYSVGWFTLAFINAGFAQTKHRSATFWWIASLVLGPLATIAIVASKPLKPNE